MLQRSHFSAGCPACGGTARPKAFRVVQVLTCTTCHLDFADCEDDIVASTDSFWVKAGDTITRQEQRAAHMVIRRREAYQRALGRPIRSVIEVGCGLATWAAAWRGCGVEYLGIEALPDVAEAAIVRTGCDIRHGDFVEWQPDRRVDVLFASQVLEHARDPVSLLMKAAYVADLVHVDVPNHSSLAAGFRKLFSTSCYGVLEAPHHLRAYRPGALCKVMQIAGITSPTVKAYPNDHPIFGQLGCESGAVHRFAYRAAEALGRGSLLVGLGRSSHIGEATR